jgi:PHD/YefM family antitoxin component YafN of YafNO toxin-antitoxin module
MIKLKQIPYDTKKIRELVYVKNPHLKHHYVHLNGYQPKDLKNKYVLKSIQLDHYPPTALAFYEVCFYNILKNIPDDKLPYVIKNHRPRKFLIYDEEFKKWREGDQDDLISEVIKPYLKIMASSISCASCVTRALELGDLKCLYNLSSSTIAIKNSNEILDKYSLPNYDINTEHEDIDKFYKHFVKIAVDRLEPREDDDDEKKEPDEPEPEPERDEYTQLMIQEELEEKKKIEEDNKYASIFGIEECYNNNNRVSNARQVTKCIEYCHESDEEEEPPPEMNKYFDYGDDDN